MDILEPPTFRIHHPITRWKDSLLMKSYRKGIYGDALEDLYAEGGNDHRWRVGDFCKAMYSGDGEFYECKITSILGDFCSVKFLGYDNIEDVSVEDIRKSDGRQARREQIRIAKAILEENVDVNDDSSDGADGNDHSHSRTRRARRSAADGVVYDDRPPRRRCRTSQSVLEAGPPCVDLPHRHCHASHCATAPSVPANQSFMSQGPANLAPCMLPGSPAFHPPVLPQSSVAPNEMPAIHAWYMAGYYTGLHHSAEKGNQGCHCCRNHSSRRSQF